MINHQLPWSSAVDSQLIQIADNRYFACSHQPSPWYAYFITALLLLKNLLIFEVFLHFHSNNDIPMINPLLPWSYTVDCLLIHIADPRSIAPTDPVPGVLMSSLVFYYQIFL